MSKPWFVPVLLRAFNNTWRASLVLFSLSIYASTTSAAGGCSSSIGKATLNEYNHQGNFVEVKTLFTGTDFTGWKILIYSSSSSFSSGSLPATGVSLCTDYQVVSYANNQTPPGADIVLLDNNGDVVDILRARTGGSVTGFYSKPACNYVGPSTDLTGVNAGQKGIDRLPDGTGKWRNTPGTGSGSFTTKCGGNTPNTATSVNLAMTKTVDSASIALNANATFTLTVTNGGPDTATNIQVKDTLPTGLIYASYTAPSVGTFSSSSLLWDIPTLANGASASMTITVQGTTEGAQVNTAVAASDNTETASANNTATATVTVGSAGLGSFLVTPSATTASSCVVAGGTPVPPYVTITAKSGSGGTGTTVTGYTGTVTLSAYGSGTWTKKTGSGTLTSNTYTFVAGDNGTVDLYLADTTAESVTPVVTAGTVTGTSSSAITFSDNALVLEDGDTKAGTLTTPDYTIVAGRPHKVFASVYRRSGSSCGLNPSFNTSGVGMKLSLTTTTGTPGTHPTGAILPTASTSSVCTSPITLTTTVPGSNNISINFSSGQASFYLCSSDVGQYQLTGSSTQTPGTVNSSTTSAFTAVPFAVALSAVKQGSTSNPGNSAATGNIFAKAGSAFQATVGGYLWQTTGDTNNDGLPDSGVTSDKVAVSALPRYAQTVTLAAATPITPTTGTPGAMAVSVAVSGGSTATTALSYPEVGSFTLTATPSGNYLGAVSLINRVLIYATSATTQADVVGRFIPDHFILTGSPVVPDFSYMDQPFTVNYAIEAQNSGGGKTSKYTGAFALGVVSFAAENANSGFDFASGSTPRVTVSTGSWSNGTYSVAAANNATFARGDSPVSPDGPYDTLALGVKVADPDGPVLQALDMNPTTTATDTHCVPTGGTPDVTNCTHKTIGTIKIRFGQMVLFPGYGSELVDLAMPIQIQYWNGSAFAINALDSATVIAASQVGFTGLTPAKIAPSGSTPLNISGGTGALKLNSAGAVGTAQVTIDLSSMPYLRGSLAGATGYTSDPSAPAIFGLYRKSNKVIFSRERY